MLMKAALLTTVLSGALSLSTPAYSEERGDAVSDALFERELIERDLAYQTAPIKSQAQLKTYLQSGGWTPLSALSNGAQQRFLLSLVFTERGLASFDTYDLRTELTATQVYKILALFGAQHTTKSIPGLQIRDATDAAIVDQGRGRIYPSTDYYNYKCSPPATCAYNMQTICIGNNCNIP